MQKLIPTKISTTKVFTIPKIEPHKDQTNLFPKLAPIEIFFVSGTIFRVQ